MSHFVNKARKLYIDGFDLSGDHNAFAQEYTCDEVEATCEGDNTHNFLPSALRKYAFSHEGLWNGGTNNQDDVLFARVAVAEVVTFCPTTGAEGEIANFATLVGAKYSPHGKMGDGYRFSVVGATNDQLIRGTVALNAAKTVTGTGTIMNLGAVAATQSPRAALHVLSQGATSIDVTVQSAALIGFGSPTTRLTFTNKAAVGAQIVNGSLGAITDAFWRVAYTINGAGTVLFVVTIGIQ